MDEERVRPRRKVMRGDSLEQKLGESGVYVDGMREKTDLKKTTEYRIQGTFVK